MKTRLFSLALTAALVVAAQPAHAAQTVEVTMNGHRHQVSVPDGWRATPQDGGVFIQPPAGRYEGLGPYGTRDMAGNVREWSANAPSATRNSERFVLGASWNQAAYRFAFPDVLPALDRSPLNGFRTARYEPSSNGELEAPIESLLGDYTPDAPVSDEVFETYKRFYSYERGELAPAVEEVDDSALHWRREKVTFNAAYADERVIAYLLLPRNADPPYQTVIYFPSGIARQSRSSEQMEPELERLADVGSSNGASGNGVGDRKVAR